jgi:hydroxymethylbilane synthase
VERLRIGTRGSALALAQTGQVAALLEARGVASELVVIRTSGDRLADVSLAKLGGKGLFIKELEEALAAGEIDVAIHSMKDVPAALPEGFAIAAVPARAAVEDVVVLRDSGGSGPGGAATRDGIAVIDGLAPGARVGTGSLRRGAQIAGRRDDLAIVPVRGNVDTRLRKLAAGEIDAVVLAAAGLERLGLTVAARTLDAELFVPAPGQGALALEVRAESAAGARVAMLDDRISACRCAAERSFSRALGASCVAPVAALARAVRRDGAASLAVTGLVATLDGRRILRDRLVGPIDDADELGARLADRLVAAGAREILDEIERATE